MNLPVNPTRAELRTLADLLERTAKKNRKESLTASMGDFLRLQGEVLENERNARIIRRNLKNKP